MAKFRALLRAGMTLALAAALHAQLQDPANLAGERVSPQDPADTLPINHGAPALQQLLLKLRTRASLMLIVAHPDDEDGGMLTYESRGQGARVATLTLTRGEGGQNLMSADFDDALGLIRTQELLAADRYFGADQFFGTEVDFGFSKTKEESFQKWTHDRVLYDAVRCVRLYRPLVLASVFVGGVTDGHGHHQVAGEIAQEAFLAAADPKVFPEMIAEGLLPWAPLKVYARVPFSRVTREGMYDYATGKTVPTRFHNYVTGGDITTEPTATVLVHEGEKSTALGMDGDTYVQFARKGLALQKTQIGANVRLAPPGAFDVGYTLMASRLGCIDTKSGCPTTTTAASSLGWAAPNVTTEESLFDGIDISLPGVATLTLTSPIDLRSSLNSLDTSLAEAQHLFNPAQPELTAPPLREAVRKLDALLSLVNESKYSQQFEKANIVHELRIKRVQLNNALTLALGLTLQPQIEATTSTPSHELVANEPLRINSHFSGQHDPNIRTVEAKLEAEPKLLKPGLIEQINLTLSATVSSAPPPTRPYFFRHSSEQPFYDLMGPDLRNAPVTPAPLVEVLSFSSGGAPLEMRAAVRSARASPSVLAAVIPSLSVYLVPAIGIVPTEDSKDAHILLKSIVGTTISHTGGEIHLKVPPNWKVDPPSSPLTLTRDSIEEQIAFTLTSPGKLTPNKPYSISAIAEVGGHDFTESFRPVGYPGIPYTNFYTPATYRATAVDLHTAPNLRIAYLPGTGDPVPDFLPNLGITPTLLTLKDLTPATLKQYDAVLLGVRAYAALPALAGPGSEPLLDYTRQGGVVIVQYNTARYGDAEAPFPIAVPGDSSHNVVEEAQPVTLLETGSPLLTWPNKITSADFNGWVAERGHGFAATWSPEYQPLLETHDVGQDPQKGGLLLARTGKGTYIYCALALYRQLPEGVPGAYRLLANLLSLAKNPSYQAH